MKAAAAIEVTEDTVGIAGIAETIVTDIVITAIMAVMPAATIDTATIIMTGGMPADITGVIMNRVTIVTPLIVIAITAIMDIPADTIARATMSAVTIMSIRAPW